MRVAIPLVGLLALVGLLWAGLGLDPRHVPSPLVGKSLPVFSLPQLKVPAQRFTNALFQGEPKLLNVWATWCVGCRQEHALLVEIAEQEGVPLYGLNYKDQYQPALDWLRRYGDPYRASGYDAEGHVGLDLGVYGLPETFIVDASGKIAYKHVGPLTDEIWVNEMRPILDALRKP